MTGIAIGRIVRYVMGDGSPRAAIITDVLDQVEGTVTLQVFTVLRDRGAFGITNGLTFEVERATYDVMGASATWNFPLPQKAS